MYKIRKVTWRILVADSEKTVKIYEYTGYKGLSPCFNAPWIDATAEKVAEILQVPLEDQTGTEPVLRNLGETDKPLAELLTADDIPTAYRDQTKSLIWDDISASGGKNAEVQATLTVMILGYPANRFV